MDVIDSKIVGTHDGFNIEAYLTPDLETTVEGDGDYTDEEIRAYRNGDWSFVNVLVTASKSGTELGSANLGACQYGAFPGVSGWVSPLNGTGDDFINGYGPDLISEAVAEAKEQLDKITSR
jgi:hypothetical protein